MLPQDDHQKPAAVLSGTWNEIRRVCLEQCDTWPLLPNGIPRGAFKKVCGLGPTPSDTDLIGLGVASALGLLKLPG